jgi:hypothetical protein
MPKDEWEFSHVPLVVLTGCPDIDAATSLLREGVVDYLMAFSGPLASPPSWPSLLTFKADL